MSSSSAPRARAAAGRELRLRIGIVLDGALVEERLVGSDLVTIGQSTRNTFALPVESLPRAWPLFRRVRGQYLLSVADDMDGRLSQEGRGLATFAELRERGAARARGGWTMALGRGARGKLALGSVTVLFQVLEVPIRPLPTLPKSIRGGLADRVNPLLLAIVSASIAAHGAFAYWLYQRDLPARTTLQRIVELADAREDRHALVVSAELLDRLAPIDAPAPGVDVTVPGEPLAPRAARPRGDRPRLDGGGDRRELDDARIRELVDGTAAISVLTGGADRGARYGEMARKDPGGDLDQSLRHVANSGQAVVNRRPDAALARDGGPARLADGRDTAPDAPTGVERGAPKREASVPRPEVADVQPLDPDGVDPAEIARIIKRRYLAGIQRCHSDLLRVEPDASGRVDLELTVSRVGKVVRARVDAFDSRLESCVEGLVGRWRFPVAKAAGLAVEASYATTFVLKAP